VLLLGCRAGADLLAMASIRWIGQLLALA